MNDVTPIQELCLQMIIHAGDARASFAEAIKAASAGNEDGCQQLYEAGVNSLNEAHTQEAKLMAMYGTDAASVPIDLILVHANDHLTMALTMQEVCDQMLLLVKQMNELKKDLRKD